MLPRSAVGVAVALLLLLLSGPSALAQERIQGIDISNHQGRVAWGQLPDRIDFVFAKATESDYFEDAWYPRNRRGAREQGIRLGAYHFARPSGHGRRSVRRDARREARHFLSYAELRGHHLLPVLDLEISGGLGVSALQRWARAWLHKIEELVGVKGMIYTSPYFWRTAMGNTEWFAQNGYRTLWIAHWETNRPAVPADNWAGEGWTFWQYSDCGRVRGIDGCVDMDWYRYPSLERVTIRSAVL